jgi:predicted PurR-regulated permease PerM
MSRLISFAALIAIIIVIGLLFYNVMVGFFVPVFLAAVLVVVFHPLHRWVLMKTGQREKVASAITTFLIMFSVLLPIGVVVTAASVQGVKLLSQVSPSGIRIGLTQVRDSLGLHLDYEESLRAAKSDVDDIMRKADGTTSAADPTVTKLGKKVAETFASFREEVRAAKGAEFDEKFESILSLANSIAASADEELGFQKTAVELSKQYTALKTDLLGGTYLAFAKEAANPTQDQIKETTAQIIEFLQPRLVSLTGATGSFLVRTIFGGVILVVATFFFFLDGPSMIKNMMHLSPLDDRYEEELLLEFDRISRAVVLATLLSALVQGLTAGVGYYFAGMDSLPLLIMLTCMFALVPFVGPAVVWIPVCCYLAFFENRPTAAITLACWGVLVVGTIDNVVKAFVLHGQSQLHPLLALLSVLGGVQALGPVGIVVGPMVVALLQTLLSILQRELLQFEQQRNSRTATSTTAEAAPAESIDDELANVVSEVLADADGASGTQPT